MQRRSSRWLVVAGVAVSACSGGVGTGPVDPDSGGADNDCGPCPADDGNDGDSPAGDDGPFICGDVRTWFVDAAAGVDVAGCTAAVGTVTAPVRTIQKAADCAQAGDTVKIGAGTYRETVVPPRGGTAACPIIYVPDTIGAVVTISGTEVISGWTEHTDPGTGRTFWRAPMPWSMGNGRSIPPDPASHVPGFDQVFVRPSGAAAGSMIPEARWPNDPDSDPLATVNVSPPRWDPQQWASAGSGTDATHIADLTLAAGPPASTWSFAANGQPQVWVNGGTLSYVGQTSWITAWQGASSTFTFEPLVSTGPYYDPLPGSIYYLWGTLPLLDAANEWVHRCADPADPATCYLYLDHDPVAAGETIEAKRRDIGFRLGAVSYVTVKDIRIFSAGLVVLGGSHNTFDGVQARYVQHAITTQTIRNSHWLTGIRLYGDHNSFVNGEVAFSSANGIQLYGSDLSVVNNVIHDLGYVGEMAGGVLVTGDRALVAHNNIYKSAYSLVYVIGARDARIRYNDLWVGNLMSDDGGAIFAVWADGENSEIDHNVVHDFYGVGLGRHVNHGIYLDNGTHSFIVHHNVVWNIGGGPLPPPDEPQRKNASLYFGTPKNWALVYNNTLERSLHGMSVNTFDASLTFASDFRQTRFINNILRGDNRLPVATAIGFLPLQRHNLPATEDPLFVDPSVRPKDLHLQCAAGSPARDHGEVIPGITDGADGVPDLGAFECGGQPGTPSDPTWTAGCLGTPYCPAGPLPSSSFTPGNTTPYRNLLRSSGFEGLSATALPSAWTAEIGTAEVYLGPRNHDAARGTEDRRAGGINSLQLGPAVTTVSQAVSGLSSSRRYQLSGWLRVKAQGDTGRLEVRVGASTWGRSVTWGDESPPDQCHDGLVPPCWKLVRVNFQPPAGETTAIVRAMKAADGANDHVFADDLGVAERANLSFGGATQASSTFANAAYSPAFVNDGDRATDFSGWANADPLPQWVAVDLGTGATFSEVDLFTTAGYEISDYQIQIKSAGPCDGGGTWSTVASVTGNTAAHILSTFAGTTAQCIRVYGTLGPPAQPGTVRVNELEVFAD